VPAFGGSTTSPATLAACSSRTCSGVFTFARLYSTVTIGSSVGSASPFTCPSPWSVIAASPTARSDQPPVASSRWRRYQHVTTREFWESCQRKAASANSGVEWLSIRVTSTYPDRLRFPLLGLTSVTAVTVTARIEYLGAKHTISDTNYWVRVAGKWRGLWKPEQYHAYARKRCPPT
jgi:hypothetical protein